MSVINYYIYLPKESIFQQVVSCKEKINKKEGKRKLQFKIEFLPLRNFRRQRGCEKIEIQAAFTSFFASFNIPSPPTM